MSLNKINNQQDLAEFLKSINSHYTIVDVEVPLNVQMRYAKMLASLHNDLTESDLGQVESQLYDEMVPLNEKRKLLVKLSESDSVSFFRVLEEYKNRAPKELEHWASLAYQHSKILLENSLLSEERILISTGLGGRDNKLRYFFVLFAKNQEEPMTEWQKSVIQTEVDLLASMQNSVELEMLEFADTYVKLKLLLPLDRHVQNTLLQLIDNCNEIGDFLSTQFLATNVKVLSDEEILRMLKDRQREDLI